eukprot:6778593-Prymnesium_polylepis.1
MRPGGGPVAAAKGRGERQVWLQLSGWWWSGRQPERWQELQHHPEAAQQPRERVTADAVPAAGRALWYTGRLASRAAPRAHALPAFSGRPI